MTHECGKAQGPPTVCSQQRRRYRRAVIGRAVAFPLVGGIGILLRHLLPRIDCRPAIGLFITSAGVRASRVGSDHRRGGSRAWLQQTAATCCTCTCTCTRRPQKWFPPPPSPRGSDKAAAYSATVRTTYERPWVTRADAAAARDELLISFLMNPG